IRDHEYRFAPSSPQLELVCNGSHLSSALLGAQDMRRTCAGPLPAKKTQSPLLGAAMARRTCDAQASGNASTVSHSSTPSPHSSRVTLPYSRVICLVPGGNALFIVSVSSPRWPGPKP